MSVAIGYVPGAFGEGDSNPYFLKELVALGDKYEYDSIWLSDRIVSDKFSLEPMVALSLIAGYSDRLKFGTSVLAMPLRRPFCIFLYLTFLGANIYHKSFKNYHYLSKPSRQSHHT